MKELHWLWQVAVDKEVVEAAERVAGGGAAVGGRKSDRFQSPLALCGDVCQEVVEILVLEGVQRQKRSEA